MALHAGCGSAAPTGGTTTSGAGGDSAAPFDGGAFDARGDGSLVASDAADAGLAPVLVGITPNAMNEGSDASGPADVLQAELETFAAGTRVAVVTRAPRELDAAGLGELSSLRAFLAAHGQSIVMNLAVVDRAADGRTDELRAKPWNDPASITATHALIDALAEHLGGELVAMTFGRDVDIYLGHHLSARSAFRLFAADACAYARQRLGPTARLGVGVAFSFEGATLPDPAFAPLLDACSTAVLSYLPGLGSTEASSASAVAGALDAMIGAAAGKPIVLQALGYPSAPAVGSSPEKQGLFFQTFFQTLGPRRSAFAVVDVFELHDLGEAACAALAERQGQSADGPFASYLCSTGLHAAGDVAKPAWLEVLAGAASFAAP